MDLDFWSERRQQNTSGTTYQTTALYRKENRTRREPVDWEKIFASHTPGKGLPPNIRNSTEKAKQPTKLAPTTKNLILTRATQGNPVLKNKNKRT